MLFLLIMVLISYLADS